MLFPLLSPNFGNSKLRRCQFVPILHAGVKVEGKVVNVTHVEAPGIRQHAYSVVDIADAPEDTLAAVIALGDRHRATMGQLPYAGFEQAATTNHIVVAFASQPGREPDLAGYCLYDPTTKAERYARIAHLCVAAEHRGKGLSRQLIEAVNSRCADRLGLRLKCRRDWTVNEVWPALGFEPVRNVRGRSKEGHELTEWCRPNRNDDLFSVPISPEQIVVAIDCNVFCDLYGLDPKRRGRYSGAVALLAATEQVRLARPSSITTELNNTPEKRNREHLLRTAAVSDLPVLNGATAEVERVRGELIAAVPAAELDRDESLFDDALLIAEAALGGADIFVTRDENAVSILGPIAFKNSELVVMDPTELPAYVVQLAGAAQHLPVQLAETHYTIGRGTSAAWDPNGLRELLDKAGGERKPDFKLLLRGIAEQSATTATRQLVQTPAGQTLAAWATRVEEGSLVVPLLRVAAGPLRHTIARQVSLLLRRAAVASGAAEIRITDTHSGRGVVEVLQRDGFEFDPTTPGSNGRRDNVAHAIKVCAPWFEVRGLVDPHGAARHEIQQPEASAAAEYERIWWPAKIADAPLPTWIVPIRSVFADDLLGHVPTLLARDEDLGLSREHVYYRSGQSQPSAPGRVIWYASDRDMAVVACSRLTHSLLGTPEALHRAFRQFGVWSLDQVRDVADKRGLVNALRFADTEIFPNPIPLTRLRELSERSAKFTIQGPTSISGDQFSRLYQEATR